MRVSRRKAQHGVQSIEVGARLLQALVQAGRPQMLRDLAAAAGMPAAKAHRYLVSFARMGLIEQGAETGLYDLGSFALQLGLAAIARLDAVSLAAPVLQQLCAETQQTVALAVWANHGATIVRWLGADSPVAASLRVGSVMPLTRSATGGVFLAFRADEQATKLVKVELSENARNGLEPTSADEVTRVVAQTRKRGYSYTSEFIPGVAGIAAPVYDSTGTMVLALVALGYSRLFEASLAKLAAAVCGRAAGLSQRLGYKLSPES